VQLHSTDDVHTAEPDTTWGSRSCSIAYAPRSCRSLEEFFSWARLSNRVIDLDGGFARPIEPGQDLDVHLVGAGLAAVSATSGCPSSMTFCLCPKAGVDLPACNEPGLSSSFANTGFTDGESLVPRLNDGLARDLPSLSSTMPSRTPCAVG